MTNETLLKSVATNQIVDKTEDEIREKFNHSLGLVLRTMHRKVKGHWRKENDSFSLAADTTTAVNMTTNFPDVYQVKYFWTTEGRIDIKPERWFRNTYPNPDDKGTPVYAIWLTGQNYLFYPYTESAITIYASYWFIPDCTNIESFPESLHDVVEYGVLSHFEDNPTQANSFTRGKYTVLFENSLKEMGDETNPTDDWEPELIYAEGQVNINDVQDGLER